MFPPNRVILSRSMSRVLWKIGDQTIDFSRRALMMGVLNVTPDSFSDGGEFFSAEGAVEQGKRLAAEGAQIIDVGGESTRPGAAAVSVDEGCVRVIPVIAQLRARVSVCARVNPSKASVAKAALEAGGTI